MGDLTRTAKFSEKKSRSVAATERAMLYSEFDTTSAVTLFNLPANCLITDAYVITETAGQTSLTLDVGVTGDADGLIADADVDNTGIVKDALSTGVLTGTGTAVTVTPSATPTAGAFIFVVDYVEYTKSTGEMTVINRA